MVGYGIAIAYALFLWWFSTGLILYLDKRPESTYRFSLFGATLVLAASLLTVYAIRDQQTLLGAYVGFTCGVLIWGWMEMSYFMGFVTGPRKASCPPGCGNGRRFWLAIQTSLYHELTIVGTAFLLIWLTRGSVNQAAAWTFVILWVMRWSAKLNLFLGVPNLNEDWLPEHIRFLTSYLNKRPMNLLFPVSVSVATVIMSLLIEAALDLPSQSFGATALTLTATLLALGILEHWFLVLPLADAPLWKWALDQASNGASAAEQQGKAGAATGRAADPAGGADG